MQSVNGVEDILGVTSSSGTLVSQSKVVGVMPPIAVSPALSWHLRPVPSWVSWNWNGDCVSEAGCGFGKVCVHGNATASPTTSDR